MSVSAPRQRPPLPRRPVAQALGNRRRSLARYVPKDNLIFYIEFDGLDAHAEAWQKTAAYKMLNNTPLGVMLEEVAAQLLEKPSPACPIAS